jgi:cobalt-zinc-cadmium efflux system outer membrane protein
MHVNQRLRTILGGFFIFMVIQAGCFSMQKNRAWPAPSPLGAALPAPHRGLSSLNAKKTSAGKIENPTGALSLRKALVLTLRQSPSLSAYAREVRVREASVLQARLIPNPELVAGGENLLGSGTMAGVKGLEITAELSQLIELGGKRAARIAEAQANRNVAGWEYELARLRAFSATAKAFINVLCAQVCLAQNKEMVSLAREVVNVFKQKVSAGKVSPLQVNRAKIALALTNIDLESSQNELARARRALVARWGARNARFSRAIGSLSPPQHPPPLASLEKQLKSAPQLARWSAQLKKYRARVDIAESGAFPDLTVHAGYRYLNTTHDSGVVMGFSIPLPLFHRNQGAILAARHRVAKTKKEMKAAEIETSTALSSAHAKLKKALHESNLLKTTVLPNAKHTFKKIREGYRMGKFGYLDVLDAQRNLFRIQKRYLSALAGYHLARINLENILGRPLQKTKSNAGKSK